MIYNSVWQLNNKTDYPRLNEDIERENVVIGGGIAGFLTAYFLSKNKNPVTLIEADKLFSGTTSKTTAKISVNQGIVYSEICEKYSKTTAKLYYDSQIEGKKILLEQIENNNIECDLQQSSSNIFAKTKEELVYNYNLLKEFGAECDLVKIFEEIDTKFAIKMQNEYMYDPLKFLSSLDVNFEIYEHTRAIEIDCDTKIIKTDCGKIKAKNIIIATHYPIINYHGGYILKLRPSESYLIATDKKAYDAMYLDAKENGITIRPYLNGNIIGGEDHRTGRIDCTDKLSLLKKYAKNYLDAENITHFWNAEDVMTADGIPMVGKYWKNSDGIYVITGFNKWGMTNSAISAQIICDYILNKENKYFDLFSPQRKIKGSFSEYFINAMTTLKDVILGYARITFKSVDTIKEGSGGVVRYKGKKRAVYKDFDGKLYVIGSMCPHMHGELKWNNSSKLWECPCHGSRFDKFGNIVSEPSIKHCKLKSGDNT